MTFNYNIFYSLFLFGLLLISFAYSSYFFVKSYLLFGLCLLPFWVVIIFALLQILTSSNKKLYTTDIPLILYSILLVIMIFRGFETQTLSFGGFLVWLIFGLSIIFLNYSTFVFNKWTYQYVNQSCKYIMLSSSIMVTVSIILYLNNPVSNMQRIFIDAGFYHKALLFEYFGIDRERVLMPLTGGFNTMGNICGISFVFGISYILKKSFSKLAFIPIFVGLAGIFLVDSRSSLIIAIMAIMSTHLYIKYGYKIVIIGLIITIVVLFSLIIGIDLTDRGRAADSFAGTLTGRPIFWKNSLEHLSDFKIIHLIGYGWGGQTSSGLNTMLGHDINNYLGVANFSIHNTVIQLIYDIGYIGLGIYIYIIYKSFTNYKSLYLNSESWIYYGCLSVMWFNVIQGIAESNFDPGHPSFIINYSLIFMGVSLNNRITKYH